MCSNNSTPLLFIIIRNLSSFHQCLQIHIKFGVLANYLFSNFPFRINHIFSGITTYSIHHRHIRFTYIAYINPRQLMLSYCFFPFILCIIAVNPYKFYFPLYFSYAFFISGIPFMHHPHQLPQKSSTTYLPLKRR